MTELDTASWSKLRRTVDQLTESNDFLRAELTATRKDNYRLNAELVRLRHAMTELTDLHRSK